MRKCQPFLHRPGTGAEYCDQPVCLCVCLSASVSLEPPHPDTHEILCADPLWPWLDPPPVALRYVMYFRCCGWRHVWPQWARRRKVEAARCSDCNEWHGDRGPSVMSMNAWWKCCHQWRWMQWLESHKKNKQPMHCDARWLHHAYSRPVFRRAILTRRKVGHTNLVLACVQGSR